MCIRDRCVDVGGQPLGDGAGTVGGTVEGGIVQYVEDTVPVSYTHLHPAAYGLFCRLLPPGLDVCICKGYRAGRLPRDREAGVPPRLFPG